MTKYDPENPKDADKLALEETIRQLVDRMDAAREGGAEHRMIIRQPIGLRDQRELLTGEYSNHS